MTAKGGAIRWNRIQLDAYRARRGLGLTLEATPESVELEPIVEQTTLVTGLVPWFTCQLALPPTDNNLHVPANHQIVKSDVYMRWIRDAKQRLMIVRRPLEPLRSPAWLGYLLPREHGGDASNYVKALADILETADLIVDDEQIRHHIVLGVHDHAGEVILQLYPLPPNGITVTVTAA